MKMISQHSPGIVAVYALLLNVSVAVAQEHVLEEVIVTAQKRAQNLQDVPIAISAISGEQIVEAGIVNLEELTLYIPNVNINRGAAQPNLFIRGVGSGTNAGFEQSVGMYIDGVYSGRGALAAVPLTMDLGRVEVLKGPQDILFGKNTVAGAVSIITAQPNEEFLASGELLYEPDHGEMVATVVVNGPLTDTLFGRVAVRHIGFDGWWKNEYLGKEGPEEDHWYSRASMRWEPSQTLNITAKVEYGDFERTHAAQIVYQSDQPTNFLGQEVFPVLSDNNRGSVGQDSAGQTTTKVFALTANWEFPIATLTSITAYSDYDTSTTADADYSAVSALSSTVSEKYDQISQELRLTSPGGDRFDWIVGGYYQEANLDQDALFTALDFALAGPLSIPALVATGSNPYTRFDQKSKSWAVFGQMTWNISDTLRSAWGLRYNEETKHLAKSGVAESLGVRLGTTSPAANTIVFANPATGALISDLRSHNFPNASRDEDKVTWSGNIQWDMTTDAMLYASVGTGFKGGGYDAAYTGAGGTVRTGNLFSGEPDGGIILTGITVEDLAYENETVVAYELGAKMTLADGSATLNIALFRMEFDNLQVSSLVGDVFEVGNAGEAISQGLEVDGRWRLTNKFSVGASAAYLDATYDTFDGATCTIPQVSDPVANPGCLRADGSNIDARESGGQNLKGETLLYAPEWSGNINLEYTQPVSATLAMRATMDINYNDTFYSALDLDPNTEHEANTKLNLRISLGSIDGRWSVAVIGKNLTDEKTMVWRNDVAATNSNTYFGVPERPRSVAVQVRYAFM